ncbi:MAG: hypothetical protein IPN69_08225 [Acidobacteria bacterium]|nr:hypothetical protein [Acidobacteriota bacterium]
MKLQNGIEIVSLEGQQAKVNLLARFAASGVAPDTQLAAKLAKAGKASLWTQQNKQDNFNFADVSDVLPEDGDYINVSFRALSKSIVPGHWLDWTSGDVLKNSVSKLPGTTVYPNHQMWDVNNWLGSVVSAEWDEAGAQSEGVPGINATYKIDALMNPRIARGLLMQPPAIHSTSMTVLFRFEFSHPDIAADDKYKFFRLLGEEVDGEIVRFIVTEILDYWDASLVFQGADRLAKKRADDEDDFEDDSLSADAAPANNRKEKTMKLAKEQIAALGLETETDDVPESQILDRALELAKVAGEYDGVDLAALKAKAATADKYVEKQRAEVRRLARLAELGAEEGELDEYVAQQIDEADFDRLVKMASYYEKRASDRLPAGRSSAEDSDAIENAGGVRQSATAVPSVGLHD